MQGPRTITARRLIKRTIIQSGLEAVSLAASAGLFSGARGRGSIFTLHHVRPAVEKSFYPSEHLSITPDFLDAAITTLKAAGHVAVALEDLPGHLALGKDAAPAMVFTLDDGYRDNAVHARPVFEKHGVPYTIFVAGGFVDRTHTIWWETAEALLNKVDRFDFDFGGGPVSLPARNFGEKYTAYDALALAMAGPDQDAIATRLDELARSSGVSPEAIVREEVMDDGELRDLIGSPLARLGAHTISHANLAQTDPARLRDELDRSADRVARITGERPVTLAYPYGDRSAAGTREFEAARELGFKIAVTTVPGVLQRSSLGNLLSLNRTSLNGYYQKTRYVEALASGIPFMRNAAA
ncbi:polysaccharide deacetylase [Hoeflea marina]|uniref:Chitooligosaccharide deacetylase n=1 Tax=Hoeflea marina TaxID=274592 RepID=A0A317PM84_9HYPH|nr:polysaccharide deacetylase family protein [Hoeflea marina]PWW01867.1 polysaccharide deacetylase [Hoeflea marina]